MSTMTLKGTVEEIALTATGQRVRISLHSDSGYSNLYISNRLGLSLGQRVEVTVEPKAEEHTTVTA